MFVKNPHQKPIHSYKWHILLVIVILMQLFAWQSVFAIDIDPVPPPPVGPTPTPTPSPTPEPPPSIVLLGSGTDEDPYQITSADDLAYVRDQINGGEIINDDTIPLNTEATYVLTTDIDLSELDESVWRPIGNSDAEFAGVFDGQGFEISNLQIDSSLEYGYDDIGLFGYVKGAEIKDFAIEVNSIGDEFNNAGAVAGTAELSTIHDVSVVSDDPESSLDASGNAGGLVGYAIDTTMFNCSNSVDVAGYDAAGGLIGWAAGTVSVVNSSNKGDVTVLADYGVGGGLIGVSYSNSVSTTIRNAYNWGNLSHDSGAYALGGIMGFSGIDTSETALVFKNLYTIGAIESDGTEYSGEIIGEAKVLTISNCFFSPVSVLLSIGSLADHPYTSDDSDADYRYTNSISLLADLNAWITPENQSIELDDDTISYLTWAILTPDGDPEFYIPEEDEESTALSTPRVPQKRDPHTLLTGQVGGIQTTDLAYLVAIPEQWMDSTAKVEFWLDAAAVTANQEGFAYLNAAAATLKTAGAKLLESYDVRLMKRVTGQDGSVNEGEVAMEYVRGNLTSRLPIPAQLQTTAHLGLCWIDDTGAIAFLESKRVTIDGVSYIEFANNNFTTAYAFIADPNHAAVVG